MRSVLFPIEFPVIEMADGDIRDDLVAAHDRLVATDDRATASAMGFPIAITLGTAGALDRMRRFVDWVGVADDPATEARMAALVAQTSAWATDIPRVFTAVDRALAAAPDSPAAALCRLNRVIVTVPVSTALAEKDVARARPVLEAFGEPQALLYLEHVAQAVALWKADWDEAVRLGHRFAALATTERVAAPTARATMLCALTFQGDLDAVAAILATPPPPTSERGWASFWVLAAADASAMAALGRPADGRGGWPVCGTVVRRSTSRTSTTASWSLSRRAPSRPANPTRRVGCSTTRSRSPASSSRASSSTACSATSPASRRRRGSSGGRGR